MKIHKYTEKEASNLAFGQIGFDAFTYTLNSGLAVSEHEVDGYLTITHNSHGRTTGDWVYLTFSATYTNGWYQITVIDADTFYVEIVYSTAVPTVSYRFKPTAGVGTYEDIEAWIAIMTDSDVTFSATSNVGDNLPSALRVQGRVIYGSFSAIDLTTTGTVLAYRG